MEKKIFLSWSKPESKEYALIFRKELKVLFPHFDIFMSEEDISMGSFAIPTIMENLSSSEFGIIFITDENKGEPWLNFEAGALSKGINENKVIPIGFNSVQIGFLNTPLKNFQGFTFEEDKFKASMRQINSEDITPLPNETFDVLLTSCWDKISTAVEEVVPKKKEAKKKDLEIVEDKLNLIISELSKVNSPYQTKTLPITKIPDYLAAFDELIKKHPDKFGKDFEHAIKNGISGIGSKPKIYSTLIFVSNFIKRKFKDTLLDADGEERKDLKAQYNIMFYTYYITTISEIDIPTEYDAPF